MRTLTIKISSDREQEFFAATAQTHLSKSELVRRAIAAFTAHCKTTSPFVSALDQAGDLVGCLGGGPADLSSNPEYLEGFSRV